MKLKDVENIQISLIDTQHKIEVMKIIQQFLNVLFNFEVDFQCGNINIIVNKKMIQNCNADIQGGFFYSKSNQYITFYVVEKDLSYNLFHWLGHFIQQLILDNDLIENIYQSYLQKSDIFDLPNDYSIIQKQCIPQLVAHYYLNELNDESKKFVQEMILK